MEDRMVAQTARDSVSPGRLDRSDDNLTSDDDDERLSSDSSVQSKKRIRLQHDEDDGDEMDAKMVRPSSQKTLSLPTIEEPVPPSYLEYLDVFFFEKSAAKYVNVFLNVYEKLFPFIDSECLRQTISVCSKAVTRATQSTLGDGLEVRPEFDEKGAHTACWSAMAIGAAISGNYEKMEACMGLATETADRLCDSVDENSSSPRSDWAAFLYLVLMYETVGDSQKAASTLLRAEQAGAFVGEPASTKLHRSLKLLPLVCSASTIRHAALARPGKDPCTEEPTPEDILQWPGWVRAAAHFCKLRSEGPGGSGKDDHNKALRGAYRGLLAEAATMARQRATSKEEGKNVDYYEKWVAKKAAADRPALCGPCPEFLRKLVDILRDPSYVRLMEWKNSKIYIHDPPGVCRQVLPSFFRHSNYASFQRQLNYFGFRKTDGRGRKGKMAPCVYGSPELDGKPLAAIKDLKRRWSTKEGEGEQSSGAQSNSGEASGAPSTSNGEKPSSGNGEEEELWFDRLGLEVALAAAELCPAVGELESGLARLGRLRATLLATPARVVSIPALREAALVSALVALVGGDPPAYLETIVTYNGQAAQRRFGGMQPLPKATKIGPTTFDFVRNSTALWHLLEDFVALSRKRGASINNEALARALGVMPEAPAGSPALVKAEHHPSPGHQSKATAAAASSYLGHLPPPYPLPPYPFGAPGPGGAWGFVPAYFHPGDHPPALYPPYYGGGDPAHKPAFPYTPPHPPPHLPAMTGYPHYYHHPPQQPVPALPHHHPAYGGGPGGAAARGLFS